MWLEYYRQNVNGQSLLGFALSKPDWTLLWSFPSKFNTTETVQIFAVWINLQDALQRIIRKKEMVFKAIVKLT